LASAATWEGSFEQLRRDAQQSEARGQWTEARKLWEQILIKERTNAEARQKYLYCLRRAQLAQRHADVSYRVQLQGLGLQDALQLYTEVLTRLKTEYVEPDKVDFSLLFRQGLDELRFGLADETFRQAHLAGIPSTAIESFLARLDAVWTEQAPRRLDEMQNLARDLAHEANKRLRVKPALVVLELACGACSALDEYTYYLTPGQLNDLNAAWKGESIGTGIELNLDGQKQLFIWQILPESPAVGKGLKVGDRLLRIGTKPTANLAIETATDLLRGELDSTVEIEVLGLGETQTRTVRLKRAVVHLPSVSVPRFLDQMYGIGYIQILSFQETTPIELDAAILKLQAEGMKVLLLDLRGNAGGLFDEARQVAERFLSSGIIVSTHGQVTEYNATYYARGMSACPVPLVVLVDGETASSAEMVAGALKDNLRGRLVGKTTFGKGSIQKVRKLTSLSGGLPAGIRITVAKFYSPRGQPYSGLGVTPHHDVAGSDMPLDPEQDSQIQAALDVARTLAMGR
jgi:carboxyl-terminal processing protease